MKGTGISYQGTGLFQVSGLLPSTWFLIPETAPFPVPCSLIPTFNEDRSTRYHRLKRRGWLASTLLTLLVLAVLVPTGASAALRDLAASLVGAAFLPTVIVYIVLLLLAIEVLELPITIYRGLTLERRFGLSTQTTGGWWIDQSKGVAVALGFTLLSGTIVSILLRWDPAGWWIWAAAVSLAITVGVAQLAPVLLLPIFFEFKPLERPALVDRLVALAERAGARVLGVFEWRLGNRTRKANAALTGIGRTRRIILSDTLLAGHSDDEIEVILAHELSHHVHGDIWRGIAFEAVATTAGFLLADRALDAVVGRFGITAKWDPAVLPLVVLATRLASMALQPFGNALSRAHERRADRYALEMTGNVPAFMSAMKRLSAQNLSEERPTRLVQWFFYTHPPVAARIEFARDWSSQKR